jgi:hypothetical protein
LVPWQLLAEQLYEALRSTPASPNDSTRAGTINTTLEQALASPLLRSQLTFEEEAFEVDWQRVDDWPALSGSLARRDAATGLLRPMTVLQVAAKRAALDQYFARTADDTDQIVDEESGECR